MNKSAPNTNVAYAAVLILSSVITACSSGGGPAGAGPEISYAPVFDSSSFVAGVDNPYFPLIPGTHWTYAEGDATVKVTVLNETRSILGVSCVVVHDEVSETAGGALIEDTLDWYAQDSAGNVWYMGEDTKEYAGGLVVSTAGSWEAGVDGAVAGIIMPASPVVGQLYRQEYFAGEAEDMAEVQAIGSSAITPLASYSNCVQSYDFTPLDAAAKERKYYASGVGLVLAVNILTGEREELTDLQQP